MTRIAIIDNLRGLAFIFMIIQHIFYFYDVSTYYETEYSKNIFIDLSGTIARTLFIFLAGCSLVLNYKKNKESFMKNKFKRNIEILFHAIIISITTYILYPEFYIRFGILHFIGLASILGSFIVPYPKLYIILILLFSFVEPPKINNFIDTITGASLKYNMMDWFPLFKWLPLFIFGMYFIENYNIEKINIPENKLLSYLSKNSLNLYTSHVILLLFLFNKLKNIEF